MEDPENGVVTLASQTMQTDIDNDNTRITTLQNQVNAYQSQLTQEFGTMEQMISSFQQDSSRSPVRLGPLPPLP